MEYKKDSEKFSFGFGTQKVAGKGSLSGTETENISTRKAVITASLAVGAVLLKIIRKRKK
ncbi:MAG: hypothetical protein K2K91_01900 [Ruminococcus sp.]|nr:hypothetical protein [Ruminococcus sp.]